MLHFNNIEIIALFCFISTYFRIVRFYHLSYFFFLFFVLCPFSLFRIWGSCFAETECEPIFIAENGKIVNRSADFGHKKSAGN